MNKQTITVIIPAKDEQDNIKRCLDSVLWCDKIVILLQGDDNTESIARSYHADIIKIDDKTGSPFKLIQKYINKAADQCNTDWVLRVDADEVVTDDLKNEIISIINSSTEMVAYGIPREQYFMGDFLKGGDWFYDRLVRLYKPQSVRYDEKDSVHEQYTVTGKIGYSRYKLLHYSHPTLATLLDKFNRYTSLEVDSLNDTLVSAYLKMFFMPPYIFFRWMIYHHGYRDKMRGVFAAIFRGWYDFVLYAKYIESKKATFKKSIPAD